MFSAGSIINDTLIFSSDYFNGLFCLNLLSNKAKLIDNFPGEQPLTKRLHIRSIVADDYIVFLPGEGGNAVHLLNTKDFSINRVEIKEKRGWNGNAYYDGKYIWLMPRDCDSKNPIQKIELSSFKIEKITIGNDKYLIKRIAAKDNKIFFVNDNQYEVMQLELTTNIIRSTYKSNEKIQGIYKIKDEYWISVEDTNKVIKWDDKNGIKGNLSFNDNEVRNGFTNIIEINDKVYLFPMEGRFIKVYDLKSGKNTEIECTKDYDFAFLCIYENKLIRLPFRKEDYVIVDTVTDSVKESMIELDEEIIKSKVSNYLKEKECFLMKENPLFNLEMFLKGMEG